MSKNTKAHLRAIALLSVFATVAACYTCFSQVTVVVIEIALAVGLYLGLVEAFKI